VVVAAVGPVVVVDVIFGCYGSANCITCSREVYRTQTPFELEGGGCQRSAHCSAGMVEVSADSERTIRSSRCVCRMLAWCSYGTCHCRPWRWSGQDGIVLFLAMPEARCMVPIAFVQRLCGCSRVEEANPRTPSAQGACCL
jgi:hypothetical protein